MDSERLPVAPVYADVRTYFSNVKMYCKRARLLFSHTRLFILTLIHPFIHGPPRDTIAHSRVFRSPNTLKTPRNEAVYLISFVTTRSCKNYDHDSFNEDLANVPFHIVNLFDDPDDQVHAFNCLFQYVLNNHASIKQIKIHSRPNPVSTETKGIMNMRDMWHKRATKTNDNDIGIHIAILVGKLNLKSGLPKKSMFALKF